MPMIEWDYWNGDDPKYDAWYDERINNLSDADHEEFLQMFKEMNPDFCEDKGDITIQDTEWYKEFVDDMLIEEYESL
jgi:hypothetical protein